MCLRALNRRLRERERASSSSSSFLRACVSCLIESRNGAHIRSSRQSPGSRQGSAAQQFRFGLAPVFILFWTRVRLTDCCFFFIFFLYLYIAMRRRPFNDDSRRETMNINLVQKWHLQKKAHSSSWESKVRRRVHLEAPLPALKTVDSLSHPFCYRLT